MVKCVNCGAEWEDDGEEYKCALCEAGPLCNSCERLGGHECAPLNEIRMKHAPKTIYLQVFGGDLSEITAWDVKETPDAACDEMTWCVDSMTDLDVEYVRKDVYDAKDSRIAALEAELAEERAAGKRVLDKANSTIAAQAEQIAKLREALGVFANPREWGSVERMAGPVYYLFHRKGYEYPWEFAQTALADPAPDAARAKEPNDG